MSSATARATTPIPQNGTVPPRPIPHAERRPREYLTPKEVERLIAAAEKGRVILVLPQFPCCWSCLGGMEDASTKEFEACSAVHRPLQHLDPADLSLNGAGGPWQIECSLYGIDVLVQLGGCQDARPCSASSGGSPT